jgi:two-component system chemotaxis sensor kinase CheA
MSGGLDMSDYLGVFLEEAEEQLTVLEENLVRLEREGSQPDLLQGIFRAAHTLKGASASMGFTKLADLTHSLENVLDALRNEVIQPTSGTLDVMFRALDALRALKDEVSAGATGRVADATVQAVVGDLKAILGREHVRPPVGPTAAGLVYEDRDRETMRAARDQGLGTYEVHVTLRTGCPLKGVRAALVISELNQHGEVIKTSPPAGDLEYERFGNDFRVLVVTAAQPDVLSHGLSRLAEIDTVTVTGIGAGGAPVPVSGASVLPAGRERNRPALRQ